MKKLCLLTGAGLGNRLCGILNALWICQYLDLHELEIVWSETNPHLLAGFEDLFHPISRIGEVEVQIVSQLNDPSIRTSENFLFPHCGNTSEQADLVTFRGAKMPAGERILYSAFLLSPAVPEKCFRDFAAQLIPLRGICDIISEFLDHCSLQPGDYGAHFRNTDLAPEDPFVEEKALELLVDLSERSPTGRVFLSSDDPELEHRLARQLGSWFLYLPKGDAPRKIDPDKPWRDFTYAIPPESNVVRSLEATRYAVADLFLLSLTQIRHRPFSSFSMLAQQLSAFRKELFLGVQDVPGLSSILQAHYWGNRRIYFGTGSVAQQSLALENPADYPIAFVDNDVNQQGRFINASPVISPDNLDLVWPGSIRVASGNARDIHHQLIKQGLPAEKIEPYLPMKELPLLRHIRDRNDLHSLRACIRPYASIDLPKICDRNGRYTPEVVYFLMYFSAHTRGRILEWEPLDVSTTLALGLGVSARNYLDGYTPCSWNGSVRCACQDPQYEEIFCDFGLEHIVRLISPKDCLKSDCNSRESGSYSMLVWHYCSQDAGRKPVPLHILEDGAWVIVLGVTDNRRFTETLILESESFSLKEIGRFTPGTWIGQISRN